MTNSKLQIFTYQDKDVRTIQRNGELWFVLTDVCKILGVKNTSQMADRLDEDEKGICEIYTLGGPQNMVIINESGLYAVILRSNKPDAKKFRHWVTSEVYSFGILFKLYTNWVNHEHICQKPLGRNKFVQTIASMADAGNIPNWYCPGRKHPVRPKRMMTGDEPLMAAYDVNIARYIGRANYTGIQRV